jgi:hypothetical protein
MALCDEIKLLLGPFDDGELEPHEMEDVALHVVACDSCNSALVDLRQLGVALRDATVMPSLSGFAADVQDRIARMRMPVGLRLRGYLSEFNQRLAAGMAIGAATAASAIITLVVVSHFIPELRRLPVASSSPSQTADLAHSTQPEQVSRSASMRPSGAAASAAASVDATGGIDDERTPARNDVRTVIRRLEADSPSVAVSDGPRDDTTVIWVPDQP